jgi:hypothetical protein
MAGRRGKSWVAADENFELSEAIGIVKTIELPYPEGQYSVALFTMGVNVSRIECSAFLGGTLCFF